MRTIRNILAIGAALVAFLFVHGALPAVAGLASTDGWMRCLPLEPGIDLTLAVHPTAVPHRMTAEELARFGPADGGAWFEREDSVLVYVLFARAGCVEAAREYMRATFDRLRAGDD